MLSSVSWSEKRQAGQLDRFGQVPAQQMCPIQETAQQVTDRRRSGPSPPTCICPTGQDGEGVMLSLLTIQPALVRLLGLPVRFVKVRATFRMAGHQGLQLLSRLSCSRRRGIIPYALSSAIRSRCQFEFLLLHQQFGNPGSDVALVDVVVVTKAVFKQLSRLYVANQSLSQAISKEETPANVPVEGRLFALNPLTWLHHGLQRLASKETLERFRHTACIPPRQGQIVLRRKLGVDGRAFFQAFALLTLCVSNSQFSRCIQD